MNFQRIVPILVLILTLPSIDQWMNISMGETVYWWLTNVLLLASFCLYKRKYGSKLPSMPVQIKIFLFWVIASGIYGIFMCEGYWDYKSLVNHLMIYLMPLAFYFVAVPMNVSDMTAKWTRVAIIVFWLLLPFMQLEAPGKYLVPFSFLLIFWPYYPKQWKIIVIVFSLLILVYGTLGARSTVLRFGSCALISLCFIFPHLTPKKFLLGISYAFFIIPLVFFILGISGTFNIFKIGEDKETIEVRNAYNENEFETLNADTRTFLYEETITSAIALKHVWYGHSLARGYISPHFGWGDLMKRNERQDAEVSILNVFTHMGLIGVVLYFFIFWGALMSVKKHSKNRVMYVVACYVSFRWLFSWIEDFTRFDLNNLFLWTEIAMCYSPFFLNKTDAQMAQWLHTFFHAEQYKAILERERDEAAKAEEAEEETTNQDKAS